MPDDSSIFATLMRQGSLSFPSNLALLKRFSAAGGRADQQPSGHLVFYGSHGRRILATDPEGNPLHECEWITTDAGTVSLARARFRLDWGQWIGLKPGGLVNSTVLDLSRRSGWERLRTDNLRQMAAQAMQVPLEEVRFFYGDEDLQIGPSGTATIRHRKDGFYILDDETFDAPPDRVRFMACLGAMHWSRIDFLPVVELFQSLLPGTGSAAFELIRGLYDDQNQSLNPLPLRYRGIPTYPSEAAFRLFSLFFIPHAPSGGNPYPFFLDPAHAHEVTWLPAPDPPRRYFDTGRHFCITIKGDTVHKVTLADDPTGLPFVNAERSRFAPCERSVGVSGGEVRLKEGTRQTQIPTNPLWGRLRDVTPYTSPLSPSLRPMASLPYPLEWRYFFDGQPPRVSPAEAFSAVLLYPDGDREIDEVSTQPFVTDYVQDLMEKSSALSVRMTQARHVLIDNFDAGLNTCINLLLPKDYTILYYRPALAQKQAQALWNHAAKENRFDLAGKVRLVPADAHRKEAYDPLYDLIYVFIPFSRFDQSLKLTETLAAIANALNPRGYAFLVGPSSMEKMLQDHHLRIAHADLVQELPTFLMHQTVLPDARLKPGLTLFQVIKD